MGFADRPEPSFARIAFDAGASTHGSRALMVDAQAPAYWDGWRIGLTLSLTRANRLGYFGLGNGTQYARDSTKGVGRSYFYPFTDAVGRVGVVFDMRDLEVDPHRGVFAEALVGRGRGYTRTSASFHAYVHPLARLVLAGRISGERVTGTAPLAVQQTMETSEGPVVALGGLRSLRGYYDGRFVGPGKIVGGIEARYGILWSPRLLELKLVAFYDAGRVFAPGEAVRLTRQGLHSAWGGGVALALLRNTLLMVEAGKGSEGVQVGFAMTWTF